MAEIDRLGDEIAVLSAQIQAATYELFVRLREFDRREGWNHHGAKSCAHWLAWRTSLDPGAASEWVRVARALEHLPALSREERETLAYACTHHSQGLLEADLTVQVCWDADRLDLGRVGHVPDPERLCTPAARDPKLIAWAYKRSTRGWR